MREAREIPVGGPEHPYAVKRTKGRDPGIVDDRTLQERVSGDPPGRVQIAFALRQESTRKASQEPSYGIRGHVNLCGSTSPFSGPH
jgi:hypothetical protein